MMGAFVYRWVRAALVLALLAASLSIGSVAGHGWVDQTLEGDPDCTPTNFPNFISAGYPLQQEFMPGSSPLEGVELCLGAMESVTVDLNIRAGTVENPGDVIGTGSTVHGGGTNLSWVHIDLDAAITLEPGTTYMLEVPDSTYFAWWGTCGTLVFEECPSPDPDLYPQGIPSNDWIGDFAFRTYTSAPASIWWGDVDCSGGGPTSVDALKTLRHVAALPVSQTEPCPDIETAVDLTGIGQVTWGDVDCGSGLSSVDALKLLRFVAGMSAVVAPPCPAIGTEAELEP